MNCRHCGLLLFKVPEEAKKIRCQNCNHINVLHDHITGIHRVEDLPLVFSKAEHYCRLIRNSIRLPQNKELWF